MIAQGICLQRIFSTETVAMLTESGEKIRCGQMNKRGRGSIHE